MGENIKIFSLLLFLTMFSNSLFARKIQNITGSVYNNSSPISIEAIDNINSSIERLENNISGLTEQNEQLAHDYTKLKKETVIILKDLKLQINDLSEKFNKLVDINNIHKMEIENIKNTLYIIGNNSSDTANSNPVNMKNPTSLLLMNKIDKKENEIELNTNKEYKNITDSDSFNEAFNLYNQKQYDNAAIAFASNIKNFNDGENFYKNLLYLGLSMIELKNINEACIAFNKILNSVETIDTQVKEEAKKKIETLACKK